MYETKPCCPKGVKYRLCLFKDVNCGFYVQWKWNANVGDCDKLTGRSAEPLFPTGRQLLVGHFHTLQ